MGIYNMGMYDVATTGDLHRYENHTEGKKFKLSRNDRKKSDAKFLKKIEGESAEMRGTTFRGHKIDLNKYSVALLASYSSDLNSKNKTNQLFNKADKYSKHLDEYANVGKKEKSDVEIDETDEFDEEIPTSTTESGFSIFSKATLGTEVLSGALIGYRFFSSALKNVVYPVAFELSKASYNYIANLFKRV